MTTKSREEKQALLLQLDSGSAQKNQTDCSITIVSCDADSVSLVQRKTWLSCPLRFAKIGAVAFLLLCAALHALHVFGVKHPFALYRHNEKKSPLMEWMTTNVIDEDDPTPSQLCPMVPGDPIVYIPKDGNLSLSYAEVYRLNIAVNGPLVLSQVRVRGSELPGVFLSRFNVRIYFVSDSQEVIDLIDLSHVKTENGGYDVVIDTPISRPVGSRCLVAVVKVDLAPEAKDVEDEDGRLNIMSVDAASVEGIAAISKVRSGRDKKKRMSGKLSEITVRVEKGVVGFKSIEAGVIKAIVENGFVPFSDITADEALLSVENGEISARYLHIGSIRAEVNNGDVMFVPKLARVLNGKVTIRSAKLHPEASSAVIVGSARSGAVFVEVIDEDSENLAAQFDVWTHLGPANLVDLTKKDDLEFTPRSTPTRPFEGHKIGVKGGHGDGLKFREVRLGVNIGKGDLVFVPE
ncbi:hypothetical protein BJ742DRAFT_874156 [Cladochytrium replicatum]|nr:hypothetical protein BJ742DRAFT_874156 [Cladochytrium replicatum]